MSWLLLEDEEVLVNYQPQSSSPLPVALSVPGISPSSSSTARDITQRKRSRIEAFQRGGDTMSVAKTIGQVFLPARPYTTLFSLTFTSLVVVDPLDRLE